MRKPTVAPRLGESVLRTAAKAHSCSECGCWIERGAIYIYAACPPWHEQNGGRKWWIIKACAWCAVRYGLGYGEQMDRCREAIGMRRAA